MMGKPAIASKAIGTSTSVHSPRSWPGPSLNNTESLNTFCIPIRRPAERRTPLGRTFQPPASPDIFGYRAWWPRPDLSIETDWRISVLCVDGQSNALRQAIETLPRPSRQAQSLKLRSAGHLFDELYGRARTRYLPDYEVKLLSFDPILLNALEIALATMGKPATAAKAIRAATSVYSIKS
jgi:hypothetical protein